LESLLCMCWGRLGQTFPGDQLRSRSKPLDITDTVLRLPVSGGRTRTTRLCSLRSRHARSRACDRHTLCVQSVGSTEVWTSNWMGESCDQTKFTECGLETQFGVLPGMWSDVRLVCETWQPQSQKGARGIRCVLVMGNSKRQILMLLFWDLD
jgi:hypothetical protein